MNAGPRWLPYVAPWAPDASMPSAPSFATILMPPQAIWTFFIVELDVTTPKEYAESYFALKEGLEALFDRPVDLVTEKSLTNPYFRERIAAQRQTVYAR